VRAESRFLTSLDTVTVESDAAGSIVTYDAELMLDGVLKVAGVFAGFTPTCALRRRVPSPWLCRARSIEVGEDSIRRRPRQVTATDAVTRTNTRTKRPQRLSVVGGERLWAAR
jgi:hypothetical protein